MYNKEKFYDYRTRKKKKGKEKLLILPFLTKILGTIRKGILARIVLSNMAQSVGFLAQIQDHICESFSH